MHPNHDTLSMLAASARSASDHPLFRDMTAIHAMTAELWTTYLHNVLVSQKQHGVKPIDVARMVGMLSLAEATYVPDMAAPHMVQAVMAGAASQYAGVVHSSPQPSEPVAEPVKPEPPPSATAYMRKAGAAPAKTNEDRDENRDDTSKAIDAIVNANKS